MAQHLLLGAKKHLPVAAARDLGILRKQPARTGTMDDLVYAADGYNYPPSSGLLSTIQELERDVNAAQVIPARFSL